MDILLDNVSLKQKNFFSVLLCVSLLHKAYMREQEIAAAVQDIKLQQIELESQKQLFEQVIIKELC